MSTPFGYYEINPYRSPLNSKTSEKAWDSGFQAGYELGLADAKRNSMKTFSDRRNYVPVAEEELPPFMD